jgi:hypothetical protein
MRSFLTAMAMLAITAPLAAQGHEGHAAPSGAMVAGWKGRVDHPARGNIAQVNFTADGGVLHVTTGPAAILWDPQTTASGNFTVATTLTLPEAPARLEAYGLFFGGSNLEAEDQEYFYFLIRHDGQFIVKHRAGAEAHTIQDWTPHAAIQKPDASGKSVNAIAVDVSADKVSYLVNGTEVVSFDRSQMSKVDGVIGLRVNHNLHVISDGLKITPK